MDPVLNVPEFLIYYPSTFLYGRKGLLMEVILYLSNSGESYAKHINNLLCV